MEKFFKKYGCKSSIGLFSILEAFLKAHQTADNTAVRGFCFLLIFAPSCFRCVYHISAVGRVSGITRPAVYYTDVGTFIEGGGTSQDADSYKPLAVFGEKETVIQEAHFYGG